MALEGLESGDLRGLDERCAGEKNECDGDERELGTRQADVSQMPDANDIPVGDAALRPQRGVREDRRKDDVGDELRYPRVRDDRSQVQRLDPSARDEERERVRAERDPEPHEPGPGCEVRERDRPDAVEARERDDAETERRIPNEERGRDPGRIGSRVEGRKKPERETSRPFGQHHICDGPGNNESDDTNGGGGREADKRTSMRETTEEKRPGQQARQRYRAGSDV
jgi:hypothetical protein